MLIEYNGKKPRVSEKAFIAPNATLIGDVKLVENYLQQGIGKLK